ncbi:MAG: hypothetical protein AB1696_28325 [Planctomycetota bacterium]
MSARTKLVLISGFRGSGKTTLMTALGKRLLARCENVALTTLGAFGTLIVSRIQALVSVGKTAFLGIGTCLVAALIFLPDLASVLGPGERRSALPQEAQEDGQT